MNPDSKIKTGNRENRSLRDKVTIDEHKNMLSPIKLQQAKCNVVKIHLLVITEKRFTCFLIVKAFSRVDLLG